MEVLAIYLKHMTLEQIDGLNSIIKIQSANVPTWHVVRLRITFTVSADSAAMNIITDAVYLM